MPGSRPFPTSLCHACAAAPRYVESDRGSVFVFCPVFKRYPPQPVTSCLEYRRAANPPALGGVPGAEDTEP